MHLIHSHSLLNYGVTKIFFIVERLQVGKTIHNDLFVASNPKIYLETTVYRKGE